MQDAVAELESQKRVGPYRIVRLVGSGGMGSVYEAEDTSLGHRVALKLLHPHVSRVPGASTRFLREGRAAARVRHLHVVQVFGLGMEEGSPYLSMELLDGDDLAQLIDARGRLSVEESLDLVLPVLAGVAAAHDVGVIHRDLKPSNICFTRGPGGRLWPKVVDFGVSKVVAGYGASDGPSVDGVIGTAAYMAPEQARASSSASFGSDQYSLAVLLYQCITGELPFSGRGVVEIVESIMTAPFVPPSERVPGVPKALDEALSRATSRDPNDRFPSVRAFAAALLGMASERTRLALSAEVIEGAVASDEACRTDVESICPITRGDEPSDTHPTPATSRHTLAVPARFERAIWAGAAVTLVASLLVGRVLSGTEHGQSTRSLADEGAGTQAAQATVPVTPDAFVLAPRVERELANSDARREVANSDARREVAPSPARALVLTRPAVAKRGAEMPSNSPSASPIMGDNGAPILP